VHPTGFYNLNSSYNGGDPAVEPDTYYVLLSSNIYAKIRITKTAAGAYTITTLGTVDLKTITTVNLGTTCNYVSVTGTNDDFLVISHRSGSYQPSFTGVYPNPLKIYKEEYLNGNHTTGTTGYS